MIEKSLSKIPVSVAFGKILSQLRSNSTMSQEELGNLSGYHRTYISLLERGERCPSLETIFQISKAFSRKPSEIISMVEELVD